jgi:SH3 domain-containing protein
LRAQRADADDVVRKEQAMAREDYDPDDMRTTRSTRRTTQPTDRLTPEDGGPSAASDRNWRAERGARRRSRSSSFPASRQEFALWLQYGGWRIISIVAGVMVVLILAMVFLRGLNRAPLAIATPTASPESANQPPLLQPLATVTPVISSTASVVAQSTPGSGAGTASGGAKFRVTGTGTDGLFLRPDHSADGEPVKTLPEGTVVTVVGEDFSGPDRVWKHVRDPDGTEGWAAADFLKPAQ